MSLARLTTAALRPATFRLLHSGPSCLGAVDPFPLPFSDPKLMQAQNRLSEDAAEWPIPQPLDRSGEDEKTLRARLVYQTRKRGTLETDLLLSTFARDALPEMNLDELKAFDKASRSDATWTRYLDEFLLLDEPDWDIFYWAVEKREPPQRWKDSSILKKLRKHTKNEGKVVRMMPALRV
nr:succinate dehydrogenase assembly factor 2, mitochondrial [Cryptococcus depauperatus CBS 7855]